MILLSTSLTKYLAIVEAKSSVVPVRSLGIVETHSKLERQSGAECGGKLDIFCTYIVHGNVGIEFFW